MARYDLIMAVAAGNRRHYALEADKVQGGQGNVHRALHKATGIPVAFKKLNSQLPSARARMKREIEIGAMLTGHPNAMPVLDHAADHSWFVMPWAEATAVDRRADLKKDEALRTLLRDVCAALEEAHSHGWIHRDIKPANILYLEGRWTLADWGLGRRPRGQTTNADRTRVGQPYGSEGFAPPELSVDAHQAGPPADVFSLGQLIGWVLTGQDPSPNIPLIPAAGPWRGVVKAATQLNPAHRQQTVAELLADIAHETEAPPEPAIVRAEALLPAVKAGDRDAASSLVSLAARHPEDADLYIDVLARLEVGLIAPALLTDPRAATEIARAMAVLLGSTSRHPERGDVDSVIMWLFDLARQAADAGELDLLEACCDGAFEWDGLWDQWHPQDRIRPWLQAITGDTASTVARSLRRHPACAEHFSNLAADRRVDYRIRAAVAQPE
ncbi:serine/threonine-protein kinase [Kitasatospora sp. NPDC092286]|uniref:serine/threonine-protein kinase n=1 Tax=Kitasatospora sp. NPDC092286 TaxID=3364087 RepID=UPI0037FB99B6